MPVADVNGIDIAYDIVGEAGGQPWVITPGGRFSKDYGGVREMAEALAEHGKQVVIHDRVNCGASAVAFRERSESELQAEVLGGLLRQLDLGPTVIVGGSGGARVSLLTAARNPDITAGLAMWWISGGVPGLLGLASYYCMPSLGAAWRGGMEAVAALPTWEEVLSRNPGNRDRFLSYDRQEFLDTLDSWALAYCPCEDTLVPGLDDADIARLSVPILVFRSGESDMAHTRKTSERLAAGLPNAQLVEPPWGDTEWNDRSAAFAVNPDERSNQLFIRWELLVPQLVEWADAKIST